MRRMTVVLLSLAAGVLIATSAAAQTTPAATQSDHNGWFFNAGIAQSFGTFGSTAAVDLSGGYKLTNHLMLAGEFGALPHAPFDKAGSVAPSFSPFAPSSDMHVNAYHTNANLFVRSSPWGRLVPYATAGFGVFTGSTVANTSTAGSYIMQYSSETNPSTNLGAGATFRLTNWLGVNADYRHFIVNATNTEHVNRFTTGISLSVNSPFIK